MKRTKENQSAGERSTTELYIFQTTKPLFYQNPIDMSSKSQSIIFLFVVIILSLASTEIIAQEVEILGSGQIKNVKDPVDPQDAATKAYVDQMLLNFGISMGSTGIQSLLSAGYCPLDIIEAGAPRDSLYGKVYQGGLIFYIDDQDTMPEIKGMVCALDDQGTDLQWGCNGTDIPGVPNVTTIPRSGPGAEIGDGISNTDSILVDCPTAPGALAARQYMGGDYNDWFLPSILELYEMYLKLGNGAPAPNTNIGNFGSLWYLSSSEVDANTGLTQPFSDGSHPGVSKSNNFYSVRAVRIF